MAMLLILDSTMAGSEFKAQFLETCTNYGVKAKVTTSHNPQANGIIERVHQPSIGQLTKDRR